MVGEIAEAVSSIADLTSTGMKNKGQREQNKAAKELEQAKYLHQQISVLQKQIQRKKLGKTIFIAGSVLFVAVGGFFSIKYRNQLRTFFVANV